MTIFPQEEKLQETVSSCSVVVNDKKTECSKNTSKLSAVLCQASAHKKKIGAAVVSIVVVIAAGIGYKVWKSKKAKPTV